MNETSGGCELMHCWAQSEEALTKDDLWLFDIVFWSTATLCLSFGIPLGVSLVHYEWYGGDPQKRSLANRFVSSACIADMTCLVLLVALTGSIRYDNLSKTDRYALCSKRKVYSVPDITLGLQISNLGCSSCTLDLCFHCFGLQL